MRRSTSNRTSGRLFDNPSIRGLSLGALDPYVRRQVRGTRPTILFFSAAGRTVPDFLARWVNGKGLTIVPVPDPADVRSEEHTSELQSHSDLVCRLLLEKKK